MRYWEITYYTGGDDFETKELIINGDQYDRIQEAISRGSEFIILEGKPTIKTKMIASINPADTIVAEYQKQGLKIDGLLEPVEERFLLGKTEKEQTREGLNKLGDWVRSQDWGKKFKVDKN